MQPMSVKHVSKAVDRDAHAGTSLSMNALPQKRALYCCLHVQV